MSSDPTASSNLFVVFPDNYNFLSGEAGFEQAERHKLRVALIAFVVTLAALVFYQWLQAAYHELASLACFISLIAPSVMSLALYRAWTNRQLARGQFLEAKVVTSVVNRSHHAGRHSSGGQVLHITYTFKTPTGWQVENSISVVRNDMFLEAPEPGTPLKVRYVDDSFFRVM